ncbi:GspE/PulE family protein [Cellvibrio sp. PSBB023]|uniref:GspE/PulE family protein n=1 Tax=Cellvibrio sp. PSBB023 TaxID=1945512 RepID=UPI000990307B|nr:GspE/PulE family protein [Cellvibrio sp. PSBB023]AQT59082.1 MSHA biogenesis protein MshE [Cellvibrio sp. PSBB023]
MMNLASQKRIRIGDLLVEKNMISETQLQHALQEQKLTGRKLGATLVELGYVEENALLNLLSAQLHIPFVELKQFRFDRSLVQRLPETSARRYRVMLLREDVDGLLLGMADPTDIFCLDELQRLLQKNIKPAVVRESELLDILDIAYTRASEIATLAGELDEELQESALDLADFAVDATDSEAPVVKLLQKIFEEAINTKASDIHIEPDEKVLRIRTRIDGVLLEQVMNEKRIASALVVRLKLMSGMDISEKRLPQDGRFNLKVKHHNIDVRISTMPVQFGESVVMRLLDQTDGVRSLDTVGMPPHLIDRFRKAITRPHGLVLVTGPTGSGKTTTLYGALAELNKPEKKIITVEDPVEYRLPRISQVQLHEKIGLTFASVLRATLRQDPDILLVGEIRDAESAEIALRASMTGHMVLSTLHTNDAITSAMRLLDIGVDGYLVATALKAIVAQRLVRRICTSCIQPHSPDANEHQLLAVIGKGRDYSNVVFKKGTGCPRCHNTGYRGRIGVFEILELNQTMAEALRVNDINAFTRAANDVPDFITLSEAALAYAIDGLTTLDEVMSISAQVNEI